MNLSDALKKIEKERNFFKQRGPEAITTFYKKVAESVGLVYLVEKKSKTKTIKINARKNYVINLVTAAEVYFKDLLKNIPDIKIIKNNDGLEKLLEEKITIWEAYQLLRTRKSRKPIRISELIGIDRLFENLTTIDSFFSKLLKCNFLEEVENHQHRLNKVEKNFFSVTKLHLKVNLPDWKNQVGTLFEKRHEYVHQICFGDNLTYKEISKFWWRLVCFIYAVNYFVEDKYLNTNHRKKKRSKME